MGIRDRHNNEDGSTEVIKRNELKKKFILNKNVKDPKVTKDYCGNEDLQN
jgi:hypothetical protein